MSKGWAKGLTATTDARVARAAAAHRGQTYVRRSRPRRQLPPEWSPEMAYVVGLIATDGCLSSDGRHISFTTKDRELAETFLVCLGRPLVYGTSRTRIGNPLYRVQFGDVELYRWLGSIGLTPRKSLTLSSIAVPAPFLIPLTRGLLDGDGSVLNKTYRADTGRSANYYWEYLQTKFHSASQDHLIWLRDQLKATLGIAGYLGTSAPREGRHHLWQLRYGKRESHMLLNALYADPTAPRLERKRRIWIDYVQRHSHSAVR